MELSEEQTLAFNKYIDGKNIFITGPGGSGKSELIRKIHAHAQSENKKIQVCALTGCAAVLLKCKAKTIHSWSGIGIAHAPNDEIVDKISKNFFRKKVWKHIDVLIIDEVSMMSLKIFNLLNQIAQTIRKNRKPFGNIQVIFCGDFYQLPPVPNNNQLLEDIESAQFCFESENWLSTFDKDCQIPLKKIFRQQDPVYIDILNQIREGRLRSSSYKTLLQYVGREIPQDAIIKPTKLFPTRNKVDTINHGEMEKLTDDMKIYEIKTELNLPMTTKEQQQRAQFSRDDVQRELQYLNSTVLCEKTVRLKKGAQVMCIINMELSSGEMLCNGSQGIILDITPNNLPLVKFTNGVEMVMEPHIWTSETIPGIGLSQIPLILAWALTIHKSQGATMDIAEIDIGSGIFECGQTYVALSRIKSLEGLYLTSFDVSKIKINKKVKKFYDSGA